jgi:hypothetical protein
LGKFAWLPEALQEIFCKAFLFPTIKSNNSFIIEKFMK